MKVKILFCKKFKGFKLGGLILELVQGTKFSHAAIEIGPDDYHDEAMVFESIWPRSIRTQKVKWEKNHYQAVETYEFNITDKKQQMEVFATLYQGLNRQYSIVQIGLIGLTIIFPFLKTIIGRVTWNGNYFLHCTEYGGRVLKALNYKFSEDCDTVDLVELQRACEEMKKGGLYA